ncbi:FDLD family class I lanthipeptide [Tumebacillus flagellatus]|uniref:FDLD family class I lanthipeptide n=1 Tax=Tumebacillus flagellatus TaxID=1157490 RepID=UPI003B75B8D4
MNNQNPLGGSSPMENMFDLDVQVESPNSMNQVKRKEEYTGSCLCTISGCW